MNAKLFALILVVGVATGNAQVQQHSFANHLAPGLDKRAVQSGTGSWMDTTLSESPIISEADVLSYDFTTHSMTLKPEALARIPRPPASGTPFVVVVNGQRIYAGVFTTCLSSFSFAVPSITVDRHSIDTNQPANTLIIERAYPWSRSALAQTHGQTVGSEMPWPRFRRSPQATRSLTVN